MAKQVGVNLTIRSCRVERGEVHFPLLTRGGNALCIGDIPMIFWEHGAPWNEVNDYLYHRALKVANGELALATVEADGRNLHAYAKWLERERLAWDLCPVMRDQRPVVRYRGALILSRKAGELAASTAAARQRCVLHFYAWATSQGLMPPFDLEMAYHSVIVVDEMGFPRRRQVLTSDLAIRGRRDRDLKTRLEGGASAVSAEQQDQILQIAKESAPIEIYLMLRVGFETGLRLGSIADLKIQTIERAVPMSGTDNVYLIAVGPGASPPVATKFDRTGFDIPMPSDLRAELMEYSSSPRRLRREQRALPHNRDVLFLTKSGGRFAERGINRSPTVNAAMCRLRRAAKTRGIEIGDFNFHWTRASFATGYAEIGLRNRNVPGTIAFLKRVMLHMNEEVTWRYITWVESRANEAALANAFTRELYARGS